MTVRRTIAPMVHTHSLLEQDACYLNGKSWEPDPVERAATRPYSFVSRYTP